jgi:predicted membrane-bound mannosyltransferase/DNA-binding beta-propeller fold protein YncE
MTNSKLNTWMDRPVFSIWPKFTIYHLIVALILITAVLSRFIMLGERVMSHDEVNHVVPAYTYYTGGGYRYDPVTHGPLQFHLIALSYTMFGDSDFSARIPDAVFGIGVILFALFAFRKYLGRVGSLVAGFLFTISPFISFYSRYTRNEIYIVFWGMALLWGVLRYLEFGRKRTLLFVTIITALHFTDKATSYIFTAEMLIFLAVVFFARTFFKPWKTKSFKLVFLVAVVIALIAGLGAFGVGYQALTNARGTEAEGDIGVMLNMLPASTRITIGALALFLILSIVLAAVFLIKGIGWRGVREERSFDLLIMQITLVLPLLAALPMNILGFNPLDYTNSGILTSVLFLVPLFIIAALIGLWWNWKVWVLNIGVFWSIFVVFYSSIFTQGTGVAMGLMGALGYWLAQQGVTRGTQPLYYYALIQIPMYEFLPAFGTLLAAILGAAGLAKSNKARKNAPEVEQVETASANDEVLPELEPVKEKSTTLVDNEGEVRRPPVLILLLYWSVMSLIAFSFAGERMPWLTTHITMPMILASGWSFGKLLESFDWAAFKKNRGWITLIVGALFLITAAQTFGSLFSVMPPFQGKDLVQLEATTNFVVALLGMIASGVGLAFLLRDWRFKQVAKLVLILFITILSAITIRTAYRANFVLYDTAEEFLVYAHAARDPKDVLEQVEEISFRLTGGNDIAVAYDSDLLYPYWWYFRDYPNKVWYSTNPTRDLQNSPIILVSSDNYGKIEPVVGNDYVMFEYTRLWWPTQVYYDLTLQRIWNAVTDAQMRTALWELWYNRDYEPFAAAIGSGTLTVETWQPSTAFRMYIRKDVVSQIWEYGAAPVALEPSVDPYEANTITLNADQIIYSNPDMQMNAPRDIAIAPDGTLYVADSGNNRILHLDTDGTLLHTWGEYAASNYETGVMAPEGSFNEPWGVAVGPDGSVYVADTWNNRIQKFTAEGKFVTMWGEFGAAESRYHFWGPRGVAVDDKGRVFVTDTGNKRVVIFDSAGNDLAVFGGAGMGVGQMDEPVGLEVDDQGRVYIADTWNDRIQVMLPDAGDLLSYSSNITWDINGWYGDSLDNKPFLAVNADYQVFVADPLLGRILAFDLAGNFLQGWGGYGSGTAEIGIAGGIAADANGGVWVSDALYNRLMHFTVPAVDSSGDEIAPAENGSSDPFTGENSLPTE